MKILFFKFDFTISDENWTDNVLIQLIEWKLFWSIQNFWIDYSMISAFVNTWQCDQYLIDFSVVFLEFFYN